jgi:hypothetical protein
VQCIFNDTDILATTREEAWLEVAKGCNDKWNFPHCLGAIDGNHVALQCPANTGSSFFNYKGAFSFILLAVVDANYLFKYAHSSMQGSTCDGGVFCVVRFIMHSLVEY